MKRLLTDYRSTTGHQRLSDLATIATFKNQAMSIVIDEEKLEQIVTKFANISERRLKLK